MPEISAEQVCFLSSLEATGKAGLQHMTLIFPIWQVVHQGEQLEMEEVQDAKLTPSPRC